VFALRLEVLLVRNGPGQYSASQLSNLTVDPLEKKSYSDSRR
jgi:hypothetical protein